MMRSRSCFCHVCTKSTAGSYAHILQGHPCWGWHDWKLELTTWVLAIRKFRIQTQRETSQFHHFSSQSCGLLPGGIYDPWTLVLVFWICPYLWFYFVGGMNGDLGHHENGDRKIIQNILHQCSCVDCCESISAYFYHHRENCLTISYYRWKYWKTCWSDHFWPDWIILSIIGWTAWHLVQTYMFPTGWVVTGQNCIFSRHFGLLNIQTLAH